MYTCTYMYIHIHLFMYTCTYTYTDTRTYTYEDKIHLHNTEIAMRDAALADSAAYMQALKRRNAELQLQLRALLAERCQVSNYLYVYTYICVDIHAHMLIRIYIHIRVHICNYIDAMLRCNCSGCPSC